MHDSAEPDRPLDVLDGVTVVEFGDHLAGGIAGHHLAMLGARVFVLEPDGGCWLRRLGADGAGDGPLFACYGRGKLSAARTDALSCAAPVWQAIDLVIEPAPDGGAPGVPDAWQAGEPDGPLALSFREADGTQLTESGAQAAFGLSAFLGTQGDAPLRVGFELVTYSAAVIGVQAVLAALPLRQVHGVGQRLRVPFSRVAANLLNNVTTASVEPDQNTGFSRGWASAPYLGVPSADGDVEMLFYGPDADRGWRTFCERLGLPALGSDARFATYAGRTQYAGDLRVALGHVTATLGREPLLAMLWDCGAMAVPRWGVGEAAASEQARANDLVLPRADDASPWLLASPWELDGHRAVLRRLPRVAADTAAFRALGAVR